MLLEVPSERCYLQERGVTSNHREQSPTMATAQRTWAQVEGSEMLYSRLREVGQ
jgi:hypothetical protein